MKKPVAVESASALIDAKINELRDWRGKALMKVREIILPKADPEIVEEVKWRGVPVFSHGGIVCTGETYKAAVKLTFARGAALKYPAGLFNSSLEGNVRRAIDIHEGEKINEKALKDLIRAAVALNLQAKSKSKTAAPKPATNCRANVLSFRRGAQCADDAPACGSSLCECRTSPGYKAEDRSSRRSFLCRASTG